MKTVYKYLFLIMLIVACFYNKGIDSKAAMDSQNVSVTVPATLAVVFEEDGRNKVDELYFCNNSLVPVEIQKVMVTQYNEWQLVPFDYEILADSKKLCFKLNGLTLLAGSNSIDVPINSGSVHVFDVDIKRGAWTHDLVSEKAFRFEFQYEIGTKEFTLYMDENSGAEEKRILAKNGTVIDLPSPEKVGYVFGGWKDENGTIYDSVITMPIGDIRLTAQWIKADAYATYCETDKSLNFYRSVDPIEVNTVYEGKQVTAVYTGFENANYGWGQSPWYSKRTEIERVEFHDIIQPISLANWFLEFYYANYGDMRKLDTSRVTSMENMCQKFGVYAERLELKGLETWDVSQVTSLYFAFSYVGYNADGDVIIGDLSSWNVEKVTTMCRAFGEIGGYTQNLVFHGMEQWNTSSVENMSGLFENTGQKDPKWKLDLRGWNVNKVIHYKYFNDNVESKVTPPIWVH